MTEQEAIAWAINIFFEEERTEKVVLLGKTEMGFYFKFLSPRPPRSPRSDDPDGWIYDDDDDTPLGGHVLFVSKQGFVVTLWFKALPMLFDSFLESGLITFHRKIDRNGMARSIRGLDCYSFNDSGLVARVDRESSMGIPVFEKYFTFPDGQEKIALRVPENWPYA